MLPLDMLKNLSGQVREQLGDKLPPGPAEEIEKIVHGLVQSAVARLDLVSRREFDAQAQVLARTREKLDALEKLLQQETPSA